MSSPSIGGVSKGRAGENSYRRGCRQDHADFVRTQSPIGKQCWQEGRLHTERRIEQRVDREEPGEYQCYSSSARRSDG